MVRYFIFYLFFMMRKMALKAIFTKLMAFVLVATMSFAFVGQVSASISLYDDFASLPLKPDPAAQWWIINWGSDGTNQTYVIDSYCGDSTCVTAESESGTTFARLAQLPTQVEGFYYNAELAELQTGVSSGVPTQWNPTEGHPVVMEVRARFSDDYEIDGNGGGIGSAGFWLWNSAVDFNDPTGSILQDGIGFNWSPFNSGYVQGMTANVFDDSAPVATRQVRHINLQDWNTYRIEWSVNAGGIQFVWLYINDMVVLVTPLLNPMSNMSVEVWNDNQRVVVDETGFHIVVEPVQSEQYMDIDYINLVKE